MHALRRLLEGAIELCLPSTCAACSALTAENDPLCEACAATLESIDDGCARCGLPIRGAMRGGLACLACGRNPPCFDGARSPFVFGGELATAVRRWKIGGRPELSRSLARLFAPSVAELPETVDALVPVPLHPRQLRRRQFNQASLLAREARSIARPTLPVMEVLDRVRDTPSQSTLDAGARRRNVRGAFAIARGRSSAGMHLVVVDDVMTTGATVAACARALLNDGATRVDVLTLARAVT